MEQQEKIKKLDEKRNKLIPLLKEADECSKTFGKPYKFEVRMIRVIPDDITRNPLDLLKDRKSELVVVATNTKTKKEVEWDLERFNDSLDEIRAMYAQFQQFDQVPEAFDDLFEEPEIP